MIVDQRQWVLNHHDHATTIVVSEIGSGKTTQIPQYPFVFLKEAGWAEGGRVIASSNQGDLVFRLLLVGQGFNVEGFYLKDPAPDHLQTTVSIVLSIHAREPIGDILVFLTGQDDIDAAVQFLSKKAHNSQYQGLPRADQDLIFSPTPRGKQKVVISTKIAKTSLTLEKN
ncbi:hypothetical protein M9H77_26044 [Catharanthus roseus]|uniref:Uncharacterized protein n=1 Tax=Catharanthus roseus TaxID=4058 RepID=A0ACC0A907_CATRO|nr:hypothetical protein M9H77_26044 [Catharanthus roseus]